MARLPRLHVPGGVYSIVLRGDGAQPIFSSDTDRGAFARLVGRSLRQNEARAHAFCWMSNQANLAVQVAEEPVERFVRGVTGPYARRIHRQRGHSGHLFGPRYTAVLIDGEKDLTALVRHIHWAPVRAGLVDNPGDYQWSSHAAYARTTNVPWLTTTIVLRRLARIGGKSPQAAYPEYMSGDNPAHYQSGFERGLPSDVRVFGEAEFLATLPARGARERRRVRVSLDDLVEAAAATLDVSPEEILSLSRRRPLALARAVVAFHAMRCATANLAEVGRHLRRDPSTLLVSMKRYRKSRPELFKEPIAGVSPQSLRSWQALRPIVRRR